MKHLALRREIIDIVRSLEAHDLGVGTAGNLSVRVGGGFLITPTGVPYAELRPSRIVLMDMQGRPAKGSPRPSIEWRFHKDIYARRPEAGAVLHVHSPYATALACTRRGIPAFHYMVAAGGGDSIRCAGYARFGTRALSRFALRALEDRRACLLANHGVIALGADPRAALRMALEVEELARQYWLARQAGKPVLLGKAEMREVLKGFRRYGAHDK